MDISTVKSYNGAWALSAEPANLLEVCTFTIALFLSLFWIT
jgi:hypothetical protein